MRHVAAAPLAAALLAALALPAGPGRAAPDDARGFLHGTVVTTGGATHVGFLHWGGHESAWDDVFHSAKTELPHRRDPAVVAVHGEPKRVSFMGLKFKVGGGDDEDASRVIAVRFGDLAAVEPRGEGKARLRLRGGTELEVAGYADDVASPVTVFAPGADPVTVPWDDLASVTFGPVPAGAQRGARRLYADVVTVEATLTGFVSWDLHATLTTDTLAARLDEAPFAVPFGEVVEVDREGRHGCRVTLRDGRQLRLRDGRAVSRRNRGILVEDARFGKVEVDWSAFEKATFRDAPGSGRGYDEYPALGPLRGTVVTTSGAAIDGRLVLDLDEAEGWELLDGRDRDLAYAIPLAAVSALAPQPGGRCVVTLAGGERLTLRGSQDVGEANDGVLVLGPPSTFVPWADVRELRLASGR